MDYVMNNKINDDFDIIEIETVEAPGSKTEAICAAIVIVVCILFCC